MVVEPQLSAKSGPGSGEPRPRKAAHSQSCVGENHSGVCRVPQKKQRSPLRPPPPTLSGSQACCQSSKGRGPAFGVPCHHENTLCKTKPSRIYQVGTPRRRRCGDVGHAGQARIDRSGFLVPGLRVPFSARSIAERRVDRLSAPKSGFRFPAPCESVRPSWR